MNLSESERELCDKLLSIEEEAAKERKKILGRIKRLEEQTDSED